MTDSECTAAINHLSCVYFAVGYVNFFGGCNRIGINGSRNSACHSLTHNSISDDEQLRGLLFYHTDDLRDVTVNKFTCSGEADNVCTVLSHTCGNCFVVKDNSSDIAELLTGSDQLILQGSIFRKYKSLHHLTSLQNAFGFQAANEFSDSLFHICTGNYDVLPVSRLGCNKAYSLRISTQLKPEFPDLSLATVYRNLNEFVKEHDAISVGTVDGQERYDADTHEHSHFFCSVCGCVIDEYESSDHAACISDLEKRGHKVERSDIIFRGVCGNCLAANG